MLTKGNGKKEVEATAAEEKLEFGEPYDKTRKHSKFDFGENLLVVPVEIEIESLVYSLVKYKILENMEDDGVFFGLFPSKARYKSTLLKYSDTTFSSNPYPLDGSINL